MAFSSITLFNRGFQFALGTTICIISGINSTAFAFSLTPAHNSNNYNLEELRYFSLKLNRNNNPIAIIALQQESDFGGENSLIFDRENQDKNPSTATINLEFQSQEVQEQRILEYLVGSLKKLEFQTFANTSLVQPSITVLPQVSYGKIYQDVYDFSVSLVDTSSTKPKNIKNIRESNRTNSSIQPRKSQEFTSYFQASKQPNYISRRNTSITNNTPAPLPSSPQGNLSPDNLPNQQSTDLLPEYNQPQPNFLPQTIFSPNISNYLGGNNANFQSLLQPRFTAVSTVIGIPQSNNGELENELETVYLPFDNLESYQPNKFNVPRGSNRYQKSEHQKNLEQKIEKKQEQIERQRERMYQKIERLRQQREKRREEKARKYRQIQERRLGQTRDKQKRIQQQIQQQIQ